MAGCLSGPRGWRSTAWQGEGRLEVRKDTKPLQQCEKHPGPPRFFPSSLGDFWKSNTFNKENLDVPQRWWLSCRVVDRCRDICPPPHIWLIEQSGHGGICQVACSTCAICTSGLTLWQFTRDTKTSFWWGASASYIQLTVTWSDHTCQWQNPASSSSSSPPPSHTLPPIASILALNSPWYSTAPVCSDTEGGRRAVTAQSLVALWLGAAECAMVH